MKKNFNFNFKDLVVWFIIVFILMWVFFGCETPNRHNTSQTSTIIWNNIDDAYKFNDDGCTFITGYHGGFIHHPTCNNPKHNFEKHCDCVDYIAYELDTFNLEKWDSTH